MGVIINWITFLNHIMRINKFISIRNIKINKLFALFYIA